MAESVLLGVVRGVAGKAANELVQTVTRMCGLDCDRETLELHLLAVQRKLANAEERSETDQAVKRWMKKLKDVANEADDVLDGFQYEALRRKAHIGESTSRRLIGYVNHHSPLRFRYAMSGKLKNVLGKISKLVEDMNKFGLENSVHLERPQQPPPSRQTHSKLDEFTEIIGRDGEKKGVVKLLLEQQDQRKVQVLPIFGMGGLGKTTTAKMVYNDQQIQQHFQLKMWHCVSEIFDVNALLKAIIQLATNGRCNPPDSIELLRQKLEEAIGQKRFLLVLDDVWNEERTLWEDGLKPLLSSVGGPGSVILVTCRSMQVASLMSTVRPHMLKFLSDEDSWKLFSMKAFRNGVEEQAELVTIGKCIVNKCGGLPLALKTMGGLLSSKQHVQQWKAIEESSIGDNAGGSNGVMSILKLSYNYLSSEMKRCFAICALFSKDYVMEKDMLIQLWMANGFIQEEKTMDLTERGELIFHDLVQRSFLQDMNVMVVKRRYNSNYTAYETIVCKMHDLMHDLARDVSDECATIEELIEQKSSVQDIYHLQMSSEVELEKISRLFEGKKSSVRTLLAPSKICKDFNRLPHASLRALHWKIVRGPDNHFKAVNSKHLRYLDLSGCNINQSLLDSICLLYNLQTLRLNGCDNLRQLPEDMAIRLRNLIHLYLLGCVWLEKMPRNIGQLKNFRTLTTFVVDTGDGFGIEELKELEHLSNRLELYNLRKIKSVNHAKEANLQRKQNLTELLFCWGLTRIDTPKNEACNGQEVLQCLKPHSKINFLELYGYGGLEWPQWMGDPEMFQCLRKLEITNCTMCTNIPLVWSSSPLVYLSLCIMVKLKTLCDNNLGIEGGSRQIFPKLKYMRLYWLASLERWVENRAGEAVDSFPVLEEVEMDECPMLASFPLSPTLKVMKVRSCCSVATSSNVEGNASSSTIPLPQLDNPMLPASLEVLWIERCESWVALPPNIGDLAKLRELLVFDCCGLKTLADGMDGLTSLRELRIIGCPAIEEFPNGLLQRLPALEWLCIEGCPELERRCREGGEYFDLVSSIPQKYIREAAPESEQEEEFRGTEAPEAESRGNGFLKRLVPCCAHPRSDS
ncbi:unnamed protein product [Alopecurus aequalis]